MCVVSWQNLALIPPVTPTLVTLGRRYVRTCFSYTMAAEEQKFFLFKHSFYNMISQIKCAYVDSITNHINLSGSFLAEPPPHTSLSAPPVGPLAHPASLSAVQGK